MTNIILATGNQGKIKELAAMVAGLPLQLIPQDQFNVSEVAETGTTFVENAIIKARHAATTSGLPAIADDSGLAVHALKGEPGVYSARYAGENATDSDNIHKLLKEMQQVPETQRTASFLCVLVFMQHANDPTPIICQGEWTGRILNTPQGKQGFGYDPVFWVPSHHQSAAQLSPEIKNQLSHRSKALHQLVTQLETLFD